MSRTPWICACGLFNSQMRDRCRSCDAPRPEEAPSGLLSLPDVVRGGPESAVAAGEPSNHVAELRAVVEMLRAYLLDAHDPGTAKAVEALEQAVPYLASGPTRDGLALLTGAELAVGVKASVGVPELRDAADRLRKLATAVRDDWEKSR